MASTCNARPSFHNGPSLVRNHMQFIKSSFEVLSSDCTPEENTSKILLTCLKSSSD